MQIVNIKKLSDTAKIPTRGSEEAAGYDLYSNNELPILIHPHTTESIGTGIAIELPKGTFGAIVARSGLARDLGLRPANCIGICDSDYRGEYIVAIHNDSDTSQVINPGTRIAQVIVIPYMEVQFQEQESLSETERGAGGFGHTGVN